MVSLDGFCCRGELTLCCIVLASVDFYHPKNVTRTRKEDIPLVEIDVTVNLNQWNVFFSCPCDFFRRMEIDLDIKLVPSEEALRTSFPTIMCDNCETIYNFSEKCEPHLLKPGNIRDLP